MFLKVHYKYVSSIVIYIAISDLISELIAPLAGIGNIIAPTGLVPTLIFYIKTYYRHNKRIKIISKHANKIYNFSTCC